jgi:hypothetical protein
MSMAKSRCIVWRYRTLQPYKVTSGRAGRRSCWLGRAMPVPIPRRHLRGGEFNGISCRAWLPTICTQDQDTRVPSPFGNTYLRGEPGSGHLPDSYGVAGRRQSTKPLGMTHTVAMGRVHWFAKRRRLDTHRRVGKSCRRPRRGQSRIFIDMYVLMAYSLYITRNHPACGGAYASPRNVEVYQPG